MRILRSWREQKVMLKRRFPILCDKDFDFMDGQRECMLDKLSAKLINADFDGPYPVVLGKPL